MGILEINHHGNPKPSFLGCITHILGCKTFIFHGFGVQGQFTFRILIKIVLLVFVPVTLKKLTIRAKLAPENGWQRKINKTNLLGWGLFSGANKLLVLGRVPPEVLVDV